MKTHIGDDDLDIAAIHVHRENEALEAELDIKRRQIENLRTHLSDESYKAYRLNTHFRIIKYNFKRNMEIFEELIQRTARLKEEYTERSLEYYCMIMELETRVLLWQGVSVVLAVALLKKFLLK